MPVCICISFAKWIIGSRISEEAHPSGLYFPLMESFIEEGITAIKFSNNTKRIIFKKIKKYR